MKPPTKTKLIKMNDHGLSVAPMELTGPTAALLCELLLVESDLNFSLSAMALWEETYAEKRDDPDGKTVALALFRDAIIQFVGCFGDEDKGKLSREAVYGQSPDDLATFDWMKDLRDSFCAHSHGSFRRCEVFALLETVQPGLASFAGVGHWRAIWDGPNHAQPLLELMTPAMDPLQDRIRATRAQLENEFLAMGPKELSSLRKSKVVLAKPDEVRLTRKQMRGGKGRSTGREPTGEGR